MPPIACQRSSFPARSTLVGRERERSLLANGLADALAGAGGLVVIAGEAGIGKTALLRELERAGAARSTFVLAGRCAEGEMPPYGVWIEAFEQQADERLGALARLLAGDSSVARAGGDQATLTAQVRDALAAAAHTRPLVVLLDDLHWADYASLDLLRHLARRVTRLPLLLVGAYRVEEARGSQFFAALLPTLVHEADAATVELRALEAAAVGELLDLYYPLAERDRATLAGYLHAHSGGNPFFIWELLRTLEAQHLLRERDGGWELRDLAGVRIPRLLRQIIERRVDRLGQDARRRLEAAAVIGEDVPLALWARVTGEPLDELRETLDLARDARLLDTPRDHSARFIHALIRETLYVGVPTAGRSALHRLAGESLAANAGADPDAVAHHFCRADDPRAVEWLVRAGTRALSAYALTMARERFQQALDRLPPSRVTAFERALVQLRLATTFREEDARFAAALADEARQLALELGDQALAGYASYVSGLQRCFAGDFGRGLAEMATGNELLDGVPEADRERFRELIDGEAIPDDRRRRGTLPLWLTYPGRFREARELAARLVGWPPALESDAADRVGNLYLCAALIHAVYGEPDASRAAFVRSRDLAHAAAAYANHGGAIVFRLYWSLLPFEPQLVEDRRRLAEEAVATWRKVADDGLPEMARLPVLVVEGEWAEARRLALSVPRGRRSPRSTFALHALIAIASAQGDAGLGWSLVREWLPAGAGTAPGEARFLEGLALQRLAARLVLDAGEPAEARSWLEAHDRWLAWNGIVLGRAEGQLGWAALQRATGNLPAAEAHARRALEHARQPRQPLAQLVAHRILGELATEQRREQESETHLATALALAEACAAPYERALVLLARAELLARGGAMAEAGTTLDEALAVLARLEARPALARATRLATLLVDDAAGVAASPAGLTPREVEILRLLAAGQSNREIAAALFLSERTVERHIANIYRKIDARNKADATAFALRHRLL
jgi:DNA-binding CsgD family transcriptional regulator